MFVSALVGVCKAEAAKDFSKTKHPSKRLGLEKLVIVDNRIKNKCTIQIYNPHGRQSDGNNKERERDDTSNYNHLQDITLITKIQVFWSNDMLNSAHISDNIVPCVFL